MSSWINSLFENTHTVNRVAYDLEDLAHSATHLGNTSLAHRLNDYAKDLRSAAANIIDAHADKQQAETAASAHLFKSLVKRSISLD